MRAATSASRPVSPPLCLTAPTIPLKKMWKRQKSWLRSAHAKGISLEAEVGAIGGEEDGVVGMGECADPDECKMIADLGVDYAGCRNRKHSRKISGKLDRAYALRPWLQ